MEKIARYAIDCANSIFVGVGAWAAAQCLDVSIIYAGLVVFALGCLTAWSREILVTIDITIPATISPMGRKP